MLSENRGHKLWVQSRMNGRKCDAIWETYLSMHKLIFRVVKLNNCKWLPSFQLRALHILIRILQQIDRRIVQEFKTVKQTTAAIVHIDKSLSNNACSHFSFELIWNFLTSCFTIKFQAWGGTSIEIVSSLIL